MIKVGLTGGIGTGKSTVCDILRREKFKIIDRVKELLKTPPADFPKIKNIIDVDGVRINFEHGWGLVRASNTTPVLVTRFESTSKEEAELYERAINDLILQAKESL